MKTFKQVGKKIDSMNDKCKNGKFKICDEMEQSEMKNMELSAMERKEDPFKYNYYDSEDNDDDNEDIDINQLASDIIDDVIAKDINRFRWMNDANKVYVKTVNTNIRKMDSTKTVRVKIRLGMNRKSMSEIHKDREEMVEDVVFVNARKIALAVEESLNRQEILNCSNTVAFLKLIFTNEILKNESSKCWRIDMVFSQENLFNSETTVTKDDETVDEQKSQALSVGSTNKETKQKGNDDEKNLEIVKEIVISSDEEATILTAKRERTLTENAGNSNVEEKLPKVKKRKTISKAVKLKKRGTKIDKALKETQIEMKPSKMKLKTRNGISKKKTTRMITKMNEDGKKSTLKAHKMDLNKEESKFFKTDISGSNKQSKLDKDDARALANKMKRISTNVLASSSSSNYRDKFFRSTHMAMSLTKIDKLKNSNFFDIEGYHYN